MLQLPELELECGDVRAHAVESYVAALLAREEWRSGDYLQNGGDATSNRTAQWEVDDGRLHVHHSGDAAAPWHGGQRGTRARPRPRVRCPDSGCSNRSMRRMRSVGEEEWPDRRPEDPPGQGKPGGAPTCLPSFFSRSKMERGAFMRAVGLGRSIFRGHLSDLILSYQTAERVHEFLLINPK